ncbi:hypothetical protein [Oceanobacillus sp. FSL K6-0251]|uniref:hypothetical protein n=1 Tax=Oceanobacillus sp. FSL K6-0251 TaxID=2921602 RepID=UPI0030F7035D
MMPMSINGFQNLDELEKDLNEIGKQGDFSLIVESAYEAGLMPEVQEMGGVKARLEYKNSYILSVFKMEEIYSEDNEQLLCDLVYVGTYHHNY